ncbi:DUF4870 domain-containing protein [Winogradskyella thalassocola]|uniref:Chloroplast import component protein (Tic20) n=1 Tax=Winogradskyella thalassocola TaxID=262004 RepID=A0A1G8HPX4_9FLAO|nr:hypothetical protein [Winogradskyella thalassocola]SDI08622.1 hypothetical protein SAMN04489796_10710 [Winogradskyella thalassocola]
METTETKTSTSEGKSIAIIAYITIVGLIIAFVMNNDKKNQFAKYHITQSLGLALSGLTLGVIGLVPVLGWLINIIGVFVLLYMWIMGLINAINEIEKPLPFLGTHYIKWFNNL